MEVRDKLHTFREFGNQTAEAIRTAIAHDQPTDSEILFIHSERIRLCNSLGNQWLGKDLHNSDGICYDGFGRFWNCNSKLCSSCVARASRDNRKKTQISIADQKLLVGENLYFLTLTFPTTDLSLLETRKIINASWSLFRKRTWFKNTVLGGAKSEEFTINKKGFHYHIHALIRAKWISYEKIRVLWTECLQTIFERKGLDFSIATSDSLAVVNVKKINSVEKAIKEVSKYLTKATSWLKIRKSDLLDIARIPRFPRMFELFGTFRNSSRSSLIKSEEIQENENVEDKTMLDKKHLSDEANIENGWREQAQRLGVGEYLQKLGIQIRDISIFRITQLKFMFPGATFSRLKQPENYEAEQSLEIFAKLLQKCPNKWCELRKPHIHYEKDVDDNILIIRHNAEFMSAFQLKEDEIR